MNLRTNKEKCKFVLSTVTSTLFFRPHTIRKLPIVPIECVHMTSRRPCWRSKQRNGGHLGGVKYSFGDWTLFLCKFLLLFHYANMASGHTSEDTLYRHKSADDLFVWSFYSKNKVKSSRNTWREKKSEHYGTRNNAKVHWSLNDSMKSDKKVISFFPLPLINFAG